MASRKYTRQQTGARPETTSQKLHILIMRGNWNRRCIATLLYCTVRTTVFQSCFIIVPSIPRVLDLIKHGAPWLLRIMDHHFHSSKRHENRCIAVLICVVCIVMIPVLQFCSAACDRPVFKSVSGLALSHDFSHRFCSYLFRPAAKIERERSLS